MLEKNLWYQQSPTPPEPRQRRRTQSFSSSLLDSILRSIDESNDGGVDENQKQNKQHQEAAHDDDIVSFSSQPRRSSKIRVSPQRSVIEEEEREIPSLRPAIMIDHWIETQSGSGSSRNDYVSRKSSRNFSSDGSSSTFTTSSSSETETPPTHRSLPNSFTISGKSPTVFADDQMATKREGKFMKCTKLRAMKIYGDLKKAKQPISPGSRISTFLNSIFNSSKKAKIEEAMQGFGSLKKSRSIKPDNSKSATTCSSFSRSCLSKKPRDNGVKRCVRFYPAEINSTVIRDRTSVHERDPSLMPSTKYESYEVSSYHRKKYGKMMADSEDEDDEDEDDLFELEIVGVGIGNHREELPVFETTDLRKIRT